MGLMLSGCFEGTAKGNHQRLHREGDALCHKISAKDFDFDNLAGFNRLVRVLDIAVGEFGDMDESILMDADIDERPELCHVGDDALKRHAGLNIGKLTNALVEGGRDELIPG